MIWPEPTYPNTHLDRQARETRSRNDGKASAGTTVRCIAANLLAPATCSGRHGRPDLRITGARL